MPALGGRIKVENVGVWKPSRAYMLAIPTSAKHKSQKDKSATNNDNDIETWYV